MAIFRPFKAIRPTRDKANLVASRFKGEVRTQPFYFFTHY